MDNGRSASRGERPTNSPTSTEPGDTLARAPRWGICSLGHRQRDGHELCQESRDRQGVKQFMEAEPAVTEIG